MDDSYKKLFLKGFIKEFPNRIKGIEKLMIGKNIAESAEGLNFPKLVMLTPENSSQEYLAIHTGGVLIKSDEFKLDEYLGKLSENWNKKLPKFLSNLFGNKYKNLDESYEKAMHLENQFEDLLKKYSN